MTGSAEKPLAAPRKVGRYRVFDPISYGGMGTIHIGRLVGAAGFSSTVAVKALHSRFARHAEFREMFLDEARLASRIQHPNVVRTLDVEVSDDSLLLILEFVRGETLRNLLNTAGDEPLKPSIAIAVAAGALRGLHAAHEARHEDGRALDIVHRDVSPANIMVDAEGSVRVLDFGVARASVRIHETTGEILRGKLSYLAPELLRGEVATRQVDIYALGVVLWEMLTGRRLFAGDDNRAVTERVLTGLVRPPSFYAPDLPATVDDAVMRALQSSPSKRFATAGEMAAVLESTIDPADVTELGAWVVARAGSRLQALAKQLMQVECYTDVPATPQAGSLAPSTDKTDKRDSPQGTHRARWPTAVASVVAAAAFLLLIGTRHAPARELVGAAVSPPPAQSQETLPLSAPVTPSAVPPASASAREPPTQTSDSLTGPVSARQRKRSAGCDAPYTRDAAGLVHWKAQCL